MRLGNKQILIFGIFLLGLLNFIPIATAIAPVIPVLEIEKVTGRFKPSELDTEQYYLLPPGSSHSDTLYRGKSATASYTGVTNNDYSTNGLAVADGDMLHTNLLTGDSWLYGNPFLAGDNLPRLVKLDNVDGILEQSQYVPFSLHLDHDYTFFAEKDVVYMGFLPEFEDGHGLYLDVFVKDEGASGLINFHETFPFSWPAFARTTIPVISNSGMVSNFTFSLDQNSLVTFTPHLITSSLLSTETEIPVNASFTDEIHQGACYQTGDNSISRSDPNEAFLQVFSLPVTESTYYNVYFQISDKNNRNWLGTTPSALDALCEVGQTSLTAINGSDAMTSISGNLNTDGLTFQATKDGELNLLLMAQGNVQTDYSIFFQQISAPEEMITLPLPLNQNVTLDENIYYEFTLDQPRLMAVNYSNPDTATWETNWYVAGEQPGEWIFTTDDSFFSYRQGNLFPLADNWQYVPAGTYAIRLTVLAGSSTNLAFQYHPVPIQLLDSESTTLSIIENSLYAFELPLTKNHINFFNLSTSAQNNLSVVYEYAVINKFAQSNTILGTQAMGNFQWNGSWYGDSVPGQVNQTTLVTYNAPSRTFEVPIFLIRAGSASSANSSVSGGGQFDYPSFTEEVEPNDAYTSATSIINETVITGLLLDDNADPDDYFQIFLYQGQNISITVFYRNSTTGGSSNQDIDLELWDTSGTNRLEQDPTGSTNLGDNWRKLELTALNVPDSGFYYIAMENNDPAFSEYNLTAIVTGGIPSTVQPPVLIPADTFNTSLNLSLNVPVNSYPNINELGDKKGNGFFIRLSAVDPFINGTFLINANKTTELEQVIGIPLNLLPNTVYNITVYTLGENDTTLNITLHSAFVHGGNLRELEVFNSKFSGTNQNQSWISQLILTTSSSDLSYLFVDITRETSRNGTLIISIEPIAISLLSFDLPDPSSYTWNEIILEGEILNQETLYQLTISGLGTGGIDVVFILGAIAIVLVPVVIAGAGLAIFLRRRGNAGP